MYLQTLLHTLEITLPVMLLVILGIWLKRRGSINSDFIRMSSQLVFNVSLPVLIFMAIVNADLGDQNYNGLILFSLLAALGSFAVGAFAARLMQIPEYSKGAFIQASFRSNLAIIGLALCISAYPLKGAVIGAIVLAVVTPLYNLLAVYVLTGGASLANLKKQVMVMAKNPLIISIVLAAAFRLMDLSLGPVWQKTGSTIAAMTLPLALIGIGGSLSVAVVTRGGMPALATSVIKILINPLLIILAAILVGFRNEELMVLAIMFACPTAAASFVMALAMGGDGELTANAIAVTTLGSGITLATIIYVLTISGLV